MRPYRNAEEYIALLREKVTERHTARNTSKASISRRRSTNSRAACTPMTSLSAEVGTWVNPLSPDRKEREAAEALLIERLALADALEARCCVNVIGSMSKEYWYAPCAQNYTDAFLEAAVSVYQKIIDAVDVKKHAHDF